MYVYAWMYVCEYNYACGAENLTLYMQGMIFTNELFPWDSAR